jgi:hypothetical protein
MTVFVPIPVQTSTPTPSDEPRDMAVALRLLSGKDCERDASLAHTMLVRLSESPDEDVSSEATRVLKAGVSNRWFVDRAPHHYELERIAEKTLARRRAAPDSRRSALAIGLGLTALLGGLVAYLVAADSSGDGLGGQMVTAGVVVTLLVAMVLYRFGKRS